MKTKTKSLILVACAAILVIGSVFATWAYLTSDTDKVTNTFTVGKVKITLDEAKVNELGVADQTAERVTTNTYKLLPGHKYTKDPTVHVEAGSEESWLFVEVVNGIRGIEAEKTIEDQLTANGFSPVSDKPNLYVYKDKVKGGDNVTVFGTFTIKTDADISEYTGETVTIKAYAVQADGLATQAAALAALGL